eukprot:TRINITY_DN398_c0_g1_i2.p1 TRINITY_DN398_c0_g1~~TRINITY_DN398_c0_g1_i2.p1  ORF type:complete len:677 (-),score=166.86 TRINITY_DN398_c0_g1_i2:340-2370(-)
MSNPAQLETQLQELNEKLRALKTTQGSATEIEAVEKEIQSLKQKTVEALRAAKSEAASSSTASTFDRTGLENLLRRRCFVAPAFEIYGGVAGLYDYGPPGCSVKANLLALWRRHFILEENMLEVDCTCLTPDVVLRTSGHVERFTDKMVKDAVTHECYRADHILEDVLKKLLEDPNLSPEKRKEMLEDKAQADAFSCEELGLRLKKYNIKAPTTGNDLTDPFTFNLMFGTPIGPTGLLQGYLRPETAQGIFVNFRRLLEYNGGKTPFAAAQIGQAFRNEISPRWGLLRVREFTMAEIEHFVNPEGKNHPKFPKIADLVVTLFARKDQLETHKTREMTLGDAVEQKIIGNQTLAYYIGRTHLFMMKVGIRRDKLRFRQHLSTEMAHYASDCWDCEIETSYGWVECVGHADRACYDLANHSAKSKVELVAREEFSEPKIQDVLEAIPNKPLLGKSYGKESKALFDYLPTLENDAAEQLEKDIAANGSASVTVGAQTFNLTKDMISFKRVQKKVHGYNFYPHVIEPSFGIGRIIYALLEHSYSVRDGDEQRKLLSFTGVIAPVKCSVLPLSGHADLQPFVREIADSLIDNGLSIEVDDSGRSIGKRYARMDEIGVPLAITVDFQTKDDRTVTLRERDTCEQIRIPIDDIPAFVRRIVDGRASWADARTKYPSVAPPADK